MDTDIPQYKYKNVLSVSRHLIDEGALQAHFDTLLDIFGVEKIIEQLAECLEVKSLRTGVSFSEFELFEKMSQELYKILDKEGE